MIRLGTELRMAFACSSAKAEAFAPQPWLRRYELERTLIVTPANLSFQWQQELKDKFREYFEVIRSDVLRRR